MKSPDVTPAQGLAASGWVVAQLVAFGVLNSAHQQLYVSIGATALAVAWKVSDAIIRHGRSKVALELAAEKFQTQLREFEAAVAAQARVQVPVAQGPTQ